MIRGTNKAVDSTETEPDFPPPAHFDDVASAEAQPVRPIPRKGFSVWLDRANHARMKLNVRPKALALVLVGGLAIGTLGGTMLVKEDSSSHEVAPAEQPVGVADPSQDPLEDTVSSDATVALDATANALQRADQTSSRIRHRRSRSSGQRSTRAYRVAVIR